MKSIYALLLMLFFFTSGANSAPTYINAKPLDQVIKTRVGNVKDGVILLPVITWGADIASIYANGNKRNTTHNSIFAKNKVKVKLQREDVFSRQLERYLSGESPYLRGTLGMINAASDLLNNDPRTKPVIIYLLSWSAGGDALVVKPGINNAKNLNGKTISMQIFGPHIYYFAKVLGDADIAMTDVKIKWLPDLTGTRNTPMAAFYGSDTDAAFVIIPDALSLTSGGTVGTGSEDSVKGAKILLSTKTANRIIADVYAVRSDYFNSDKDNVANLVYSLLQAGEALTGVVNERNSRSAEYQDIMRSAADILLDSPQAVSDTEGLYADAEYAHYNGNVAFFEDPKNPRNFDHLNQEIQASFKKIGLVSGRVKLKQAHWDYTSLLKAGLTQVDVARHNRFNPQAVASIVTKKQQQGNLENTELFSFEIFFKSNKPTFNVSLYKDAINKVINLATTYGGAVITVEGHADPLEYLRRKKDNASAIVLGRIKQSARTLSVNRALRVRDGIIKFASNQGVSMDPSQYAVVGHGIAEPKTGICGADPCAPKTEAEWFSNMRVEFRIIQVEAEASVFKPL